MKVTFLGTGTSQGIPVITCECEVCCSVNPRDKRLRTSVMIETNDRTFVIDSGPDFREQMLREKVKKLDALIFTHEHRDHTAGLDDVRAYNYPYDKPMETYVSEDVERALKANFSYIFTNSNYPGIPKINLNRIHKDPFVIHNVEFLPIEVFHNKMPVLGFRVNDFTYITDANRIPDKEKEKIIGSKVLALNALRRHAHVAHFTFDEAMQLIKDLKPGKAYLTHISHQLGLHAEVEKELPENVYLAYDGLKVDVF